MPELRMPPPRGDWALRRREHGSRDADVPILRKTIYNDISEMNDEVVELLRECRDLLREILGRGVETERQKIGKRMTFAELSRAYLDYSKSKVKISTLSTYENLLIASPFAKSLATRDVSELTRSTVQLWIDSFDEHTS